MSKINSAILKVAQSNPEFRDALKAELKKEAYAKLYGAGRFWVRLDKITQDQRWEEFYMEEIDKSDSFFDEHPLARNTLWIARGKTWENLLPVATDNNLKIPNGQWRANVFGNDLDTNNEKKEGRVTFFRLSFGTGNAQGTPEESIRDRKAYMAWAHHLGAKLNRKDYAEKMEDIDYDISTETAKVALETKTAFSQDARKMGDMLSTSFKQGIGWGEGIKKDNYESIDDDLYDNARKAKHELKQIKRIVEMLPKHPENPSLPKHLCDALLTYYYHRGVEAGAE